MILDKLKQIFKGKNEKENVGAADNVTEQSDGENEQSDGDSVREESGGIDPDEAFGAKIEENDSKNEEESFNLLDAKDGEEPEELEEEKPQEQEASINYDEEINKLLKQDAETEIDDVDYEYINDISVYDTIRNKKDEIIQEISDEMNNEKAEREEKDTSLNLFYVALIGILVIMIVAVVMLIFLIPSGKKKEEVKKDPNVLNVSSYKANNANYIYLDQRGTIDEQELILSKILVDSRATLFYFDNKFDIQKYNIILSDDKENVYGMDLSFVQNMEQDEDENDKTVLHFEPLNLNAKSIKLSLYNSVTGSRVEFPFYFDTPLEEREVKYIFDQEVKSDNKDVKVTIDNAVFSSAGSVLNYKIETLGQGFSIVQDKSKSAEGITLEENASNIKKLKKYASTYSFENGNMVLGRMDFRSIENLNSKIYITFENLYKSYTINRDFSAASIYNTPDKKPISIDAGNYRVVLEGLGAYNDRVVLVYHGEDKNIKYDPENPNANRVEVRLDAEVVSQTSSGMEIILDGSCKSANYGTDMTFMINESNRDLFYGLGAGNLKIRVNSILVKTDDAKTEFNLRKAETENEESREKACDDVVEAFEGRLSYKSGEKSIESLNGFSENLIKEGSILSEYKPESLSEKAQYSAQIISSAIKGDKFYAVVQEVWKGISGIKEVHFYRTHKVVAQKGDYFWNIIEDNVIK